MLRNRRFFVLLWLALSGPAARAADAVDSSWLKIIESLRAKGISTVGDLDLQELENQGLHSVRWTSNPDAPPSGVAGSRSSAYYDWSKKEIFLSQKLPPDALASLPQLELHELLGVLHYNDNAYALSTALAVLDQTSDEPALSRATNEYGKTIFSKDNLHSTAFLGGSSVGGGGDLTTLFIKLQVLRSIQAEAGHGELAALPEDFLLSYPKVDFEPITDQAAQAVVLDYKLKTAAGRTDEEFGVFLPIRRWQAGGKIRADLLAEIQRKVLEIFPAGAGGAGPEPVRMKPLCAGGLAVSFPATSDAAVRHIQEERASLLSGCFKDGASAFNFESQAPSVAPSQLPRQAGMIYLDCAFTVDGQRTDYSEEIPVSTLPMKRFVSFSVGSESLQGLYRLDAEGKLDLVAITSGDPQHGLALTLGKLTGAQRGSVSLNLQAHQVDFSCRGR